MKYYREIKITENVQIMWVIVTVANFGVGKFKLCLRRKSAKVIS